MCYILLKKKILRNICFNMSYGQQWCHHSICILNSNWLLRNPNNMWLMESNLKVSLKIKTNKAKTLMKWPMVIRDVLIFSFFFLQFFSIADTITDSFGPIHTIHTVLETKTRFSKRLTHFTCLHTRSNLLSVLCKTLHKNATILHRFNHVLIKKTLYN